MASGCDWDHVERVFLQAIELPPLERAAFLDRACAGSSPMRREVESLLAEDSSAQLDLDSAIQSEAACLFDEPVRVDARLGPYRIIEEIGRGGMSSVFLAERDDDLYRKRVAIKVVKRGMDTDEVLNRFRHERQILAGLEHPYIARLIDGGTTLDGRPFFVMERVEGEPIHFYCKNRNLDLKPRLQLFLRVCDAVSHAHRSLIVHRDLKPGNILVTADGVPKLLDFGVAKLLDPVADPGLTIANRGPGPLTPEYASPEQVRGLPITTATDIYALGAILYELLTGSRAQSIAKQTPAEIDRIICDTHPPRPSILARGLHADLDNIVLLAMRKEPERRYSSVEQLATDIRCHLDGLPVLARRDSFAYRTGKFLRRNRLAIAAGALVFGSLVAGVLVSFREARRAEAARLLAENQKQAASYERARAEREATDAGRQRREAELQRAAAEHQRQIADQRFEQVRQLAGKFLFDFHDSIATLPGSTPARKMVVETGLRYYDTLVHEADGNRALLEEIARGYDRMGDVQGNPYLANLGDSAGALASYEKARAIRNRISDPSPGFLADRIGGAARISEILSVKGDVQTATQTLRQMIALAEGSPLSAARPVREALARAYSDLCAIPFRTGSFAEALEPAAKLLDLWTKMARESRDPVAERAGLSLAHTRLGDALLRLGRHEEALSHVRTAATIDKELADSNPNSSARLKKYFIDQSLLWLIFRDRPHLAGPGQAMQAAQAAADLADRLLAADPANSSAFFDVTSAQSMLGDWFRDNGQAEVSISHYRRALDAIERFAANRPGELLTEDSRAYAHERLGAGLAESGHLDQALAQLRQADEAVTRAETRNPGLLQLASRRTDIASVRGNAYAHFKMWPEASAAFGEAVSRCEDLVRRDPRNATRADNLLSMRLKLADSYAAMEQWSKAAEMMERALQSLVVTASQRPLTPSEEEHRKGGAEKLALWKQRASGRN